MQSMVIQKYNIIIDEEYNVDTTGLNLQEFVYMNIRENIKDEMDSSEATNAFKVSI